MCNQTREIRKKLKEAGFYIKRQSKHEIWTNGERDITIPRGASNNRTIKSVLQQIEGKGPFYSRQNNHVKEN